MTNIQNELWCSKFKFQPHIIQRIFFFLAHCNETDQFARSFKKKKYLPNIKKFFLTVLSHCLSKSAMTNRKKSPPNHFIGAAFSNKVKSSINNLLFTLEIYLLLAGFKKCKGVLIAFLHFTFLKQLKPVKDTSTHHKFHKTIT